MTEALQIAEEVPEAQFSRLELEEENAMLKKQV